MFFFFVLSSIFFSPMMFIALFYAGVLYLFGLLVGWKRLRLYARNLALGVWDQGLATIWGQAPDISISEALGRAAIANDQRPGAANKFILWFGRFVDKIFHNRLWSIQENHIRESIDHGESWKNTITSWHWVDGDTLSGGE